MGGGERPEENPAHAITLAAFAIDPTEVTVSRFAKFVAATRHRTEAEKWGWSGVFDMKGQAWKPVKGATWRKMHNAELVKINAPLVNLHERLVNRLFSAKENNSFIS